MRTKVSLLVLVGFMTLLFGQDNRYGKVSKEELAKTQSLIDPDSAAEILYEKATVTLEFYPINGTFMLVSEYEGRIKVYDKNNVNERFLGREVSLYAPSSNREKISSFRGSTYNLENGKVVETKVKSTDIFKERKNKNWEVEKFTFPNVQNGSVLEYKYTISSPYARDIGRWFFQDEIPVVYSQFIFKRPEFYIYSQDNRGDAVGRTKENIYPDNAMNYNNLITEMTYENVPPLKKEPFVFNLNNLKTSTRFELMKFEHSGYRSENYATSWGQIGKDLMVHSEFGAQLKGNNFLDEAVQVATANATTPTEQMQGIFRFVKDNYTWNRMYGLRTDKGVRSTFKDKTGNAADINLMLVSMLQKAGLNAHPVALSTVGNLILNYSFPSVTSLNFVIASVEINNQLYLMDATEKYSKINMLPMRNLNHRGFRIMEKEVQELSLTNYGLSTIKELAVMTMSADGRVSGNYSETRDSYFAMSDKIRLTEDPKEFEKEYEKNYSFDLENFRIHENEENGMFRYTFKLNDIQGGEVIGNKIIVNPLLFTKLEKSSFTNDSRNYPLEFGTLISKEKTIKIKIPEGFKVESLPAEKSFVVEGNVAGYTYKVIESDGYIVVSTLYQIGQSSLPNTYYKPMKEFESQQINAENQDVVLVKI
jgi:hypothetical protein